SAGGRIPLTRRADVFQHVEAVIAAEKRAVAAKSPDRRANQRKARRNGNPAEPIGNQDGPETSQSFVIAAVIGVGGTHAGVVVDDAGANLFESLVLGPVEKMASGDGDVRGVGPFALGQGAGARLGKETS